ncbi:MAG: sensor histidine kinase, partial [Sciscionella sp.]
GHLTETLDLTVLAEDVRSGARSAAQAQGISVTMTAAESEALVRGTRGGLRRALTALLDNALRHARSRVQLALQVDGDRVTVTVTDDGPGIDPAVLPTLFARFSSGGEIEHSSGGEPARRRYGLGLALVSEIANRHGGSVAALPAPQGGARLRLTLPRARR